MHGSETAKVVTIYQDDTIRVLFLTKPDVSLTTPANVGQGSVIFAQARSVARTSIWGGFSKLNKWKRCVNIHNSSFLIETLVSMGKWLSKFRRIAAPSTPKTKQLKKIIRFVLDCLALKDRGTTIIRNVRTHPHNVTVAYPRRPESRAIPHYQNPKLYGTVLRPHTGSFTNKICC